MAAHPEFIEGRKTKAQLLQEFLSAFQQPVTREDFVEYCADLAMGMPNDDFFVKHMEQVWGLQERQEPAFAQTLGLLAKEVRARVLELAKGDAAAFPKIFADFDYNGSGRLTLDATAAMLAKLRIAVDKKFVLPLHRLLDRDGSGAVEPEEFRAFLTE